MRWFSAPSIQLQWRLSLFFTILSQGSAQAEFAQNAVTDETHVRSALGLRCAFFFFAATGRAFIRTARVVRHRGAILLLMGQDMNCFPTELFGLAALVGVMNLRSPALFEFIRERTGLLEGRRYKEVAKLEPGWMLLGSALSTDPEWRCGARIVRLRPPLCMHGGFTRAMV
jgi:hypothetical protein